MAGKFPPEFIQKLRAAISLPELVSEHVTLKKSGSNFSGLCPFHSERTPSFYVNDKKQLYHCYGCGAGGDAISFLKEIHGLSFFEAIEELSERTKIPLPQGASMENETPEQKARREEFQKKNQTALRLNRFVATFYRQNYEGAPPIQEYIRKRGVDEATAKGFFVGLARAEWSSLADHLQKAKAPMGLATELGLIRASQKQGAGHSPYFDLFRDRVIFPIIDPRGRVVGYGGRKLSETDEGPKYLNSSESFIFQKSRLLYGLYQAQRSIRDRGEVLITEGYFDVMTLHAFGFTHAVATCGTALTPEHLKILQRLAPKITLIFDNDRAGVEATERAMELGLGMGLALHTVALPPKMDPDEVCLDANLGPKVLEEWIAHSRPALDLRLDAERMASQASSEARTESLKKVAGWLGLYQDPVGREVRLDWVVQNYGISRNQLEKWVKVAETKDSGRPTAIEVGSSSPASGPKLIVRSGHPGSKGHSSAPAKLTKPEKILITALLRWKDYTDLLKGLRQELPERSSLADLFVYPPAKQFVQEFLQVPGAYQELALAPEWVTERIQDPILLQTLTAALVSPEPLYTHSEVKVSMDAIVYKIWARISHELRQTLAGAEANKDKDLEQKILKDYLDVQRKLKEFDKFYESSE